MDDAWAVFEEVAEVLENKAQVQRVRHRYIHVEEQGIGIYIHETWRGGGGGGGEGRGGGEKKGEEGGGRHVWGWF